MNKMIFPEWRGKSLFIKYFFNATKFPWETNCAEPDLQRNSNQLLEAFDLLDEKVKGREENLRRWAGACEFRFLNQREFGMYLIGKKEDKMVRPAEIKPVHLDLDALSPTWATLYSLF